MVEPAFELIAYSEAALCNQLFKDSKVQLSEASSRRHLVYLRTYLEELRAATIVVERKYVDRDYLEDFAAYYVRCFSDYPRTCRRLHFFSKWFPEDEFLRACNGVDQAVADAVLASYLGFIVVKPLPQTVVGRTCLATYPADGGRRSFPTTRRYEVGLFGLALSVESVAYQQQDKVVAACATSALWSAFHGSGVRFQHSIPSPVEITRQAGQLAERESRLFPNAGLSPADMSRAIRAVGLEPLVINATDPHEVKGTLYAYLKSHIPVLMNAKLHNSSKAEEMGVHGVAVTGFSIASAQPVPEPESGLLLRASRMDKIYVHDDQVGPFARMPFLPANSRLGTQWNAGDVEAEPDVLLVPLYHKIRIPYGTIHDIVSEFDSVLEELRQANQLRLSGRLEWDIYLTINSSLKQEIRTSLELSIKRRQELVFENLPRFIWRADARLADKLQLGLLFDATDIEQGLMFLCGVEYDGYLCTYLSEIAAQISDQEMDPPLRHIFKWFAGR